jgi:hypothetical protein
MEGRSLLRVFESKENFLIWGNFYEEFERYAVGSCKRVSLSIGAPLGNLEGVRLPGLFERKRKVYLGSILDPEDIHILTLGIIWNFSNGRGLP